MSRQAQWAHRKRAELIKLLGGRCAECGERHALEFHHRPGTRTWVARKKSRWMRIILYQRDIEAGLISLLCHDCHKSVGR
jgi:hypothetical protein